MKEWQSIMNVGVLRILSFCIDIVMISSLKPTNTKSLTEVERIREANIQRNNDFIGIFTLSLT
jgi:hypothetical protein